MQPIRILAVAVAAACLPAQAAFIVDQVLVRREGADVVLELQFSTDVLFQRVIATAAGDTVIVAYQLVASTNREVGPGSQLLALDHLRGLERLRLTDEPTQAERERRIVLRLGTAGPVLARAGRDSQRLEIVLVGQGGAITGPAAATPDDGAPALLATARARLAAGEPLPALEALNALLDQPPGPATREAQALAGQAWEAAGLPERARAEYETFLKLYPEGDDAEAVRHRLAGLPAGTAAPVASAEPSAHPPEDTTLTASTSMTWLGGNGRVRSQEFQDSPIAGLPPVAGEPQFSDDRTRQLYNDVDIHWRRRNTELDQRFVFRDAYTTDLERSDRSKNRLSSLYFDHKALKDGWGGRIGRQSGTGGGILGRFDGAQGWWMASRTLKLGAAAGAPAEPLFDTKRWFWGLRADAERIVGGLGAGVFLIEQRIDGELDRRAAGLDLRWFDGGSTLFAQVDYDITFGALNIASVQGTHVTADDTVWTVLLDRRVLSTLSLGNALTFEDPSQPGVIFRNIQDRLANTTVDALRRQIRRLTPMISQAQLAVTHPLSAHWTTGGSVQLTNTGAIPPVPEVPGFEDGRPATGDIVSATAQLIGLNLLSDRDTHVGAVTVIRSPGLDGLVVSYNQSSWWWTHWQFEPSLQYYRDRLPEGSRSERWTPGLRLTYRGWKRVALETALTYEIGTASREGPDPAGGPLPVTTRERSNRASYSLGARLEF